MRQMFSWMLFLINMARFCAIISSCTASEVQVSQSCPNATMRNCYSESQTHNKWTKRRAEACVVLIRVGEGAVSTVQLKCDGTWWRTGGEVKGKLANGVGTLHTTSEHGVSTITTADAHTSAASSRLNWRPRRFKWTRPFRRKTKSGFCACAITFQSQSTKTDKLLVRLRLDTVSKQGVFGHNFLH